MPFHFTHPWWLPALAGALAWVIWLGWKSDSSLVGWRRPVSLGLRILVTLALGLALAGLRYRLPTEGVNVFYVLDRSDSVPAEQQEMAREWVNRSAARKKTTDQGGVIVFGADAAIESMPNPVVDLPRVQAVVSGVGSDLAGALRLATAAFPEGGQRRVVVLTDGNTTAGDPLQAALAAKALGVSVDVVPLGASRGNDASIQKVTVPTQLKKGQTFDVKIFVFSDRATRGRLTLFRNEQLLGTQEVELEAGKNLFSFPQTLPEAGFYTYDVRLETPGDAIVQNNRATGYTAVRGEPRVLIVSSDPAADRPLAEALASSRLEVRMVEVLGFPASLAEMQSYDAIFLSNIAAGDLGPDLMRLVQSAVRDFGVGLAVLGGDQAFAAGGYRSTPLEEALPVDMELNSKKVLPRGALVLVVHATEFPNGNQWARDIAFAALQALGPQDELGIVLWDGQDKWLFELSPVGDKKQKGRAIMGMNPGDMPMFGNVMAMAHQGLQKSTANLKHMVVFSDGDPGAPSPSLVQQIVGDRITISTVMIGGHVEPSLMTELANKGRGHFYDVRSPGMLPQIFIKEAAVILKAAIIEDPFQPQVGAGSEIIRAIAPGEFPRLRGYVASTPKARAEVPLLSDKGDPVLAQWQYGLGRAVAFTSDARAKWAADWMAWPRYRQFWSQLAQWTLRKVDASDLNSEITLEEGAGRLAVEATDAEGNYRNFLNLQAVVVNPKGERETVRLEQKGPGRYEVAFPAKEVGVYMVNLLDLANGQIRGQQALGASVNYSPEFLASGANLGLLERLAQATGGKRLDPASAEDNPYLHDRERTYQAVDLWWWCLLGAVVLFPFDVGIRRVQLDREELARAWRKVLGWFGIGRRRATAASEANLAALLARKEQVRSTKTGEGAAPAVAPVDPGLFRPQQSVTPASAEAEPAKPVDPPPAEKPKEKPAEGEASMASRLLEAKRRARKK